MAETPALVRAEASEPYAGLKHAELATLIRKRGIKLHKKESQAKDALINVLETYPAAPKPYDGKTKDELRALLMERGITDYNTRTVKKDLVKKLVDGDTKAAEEEEVSTPPIRLRLNWNSRERDAQQHLSGNDYVANEDPDEETVLPDQPTGGQTSLSNTLGSRQQAPEMNPDLQIDPLLLDQNTARQVSLADETLNVLVKESQADKMVEDPEPRGVTTAPGNPIETVDTPMVDVFADGTNKAAEEAEQPTGDSPTLAAASVGIPHLEPGNDNMSLLDPAEVLTTLVHEAQTDRISMTRKAIHEAKLTSATADAEETEKRNALDSLGQSSKATKAPLTETQANELYQNMEVAHEPAAGFSAVRGTLHAPDVEMEDAPLILSTDSGSPLPHETSNVNITKTMAGEPTVPDASDVIVSATHMLNEGLSQGRNSGNSRRSSTPHRQLIFSTAWLNTALPGTAEAHSKTTPAGDEVMEESTPLSPTELTTPAHDVETTAATLGDRDYPMSTEPHTMSAPTDETVASAPTEPQGSVADANLARSPLPFTAETSASAVHKLREQAESSSIKPPVSPISPQAPSAPSPATPKSSHRKTPSVPKTPVRASQLHKKKVLTPKNPSSNKRKDKDFRPGRVEEKDSDSDDSAVGKPKRKKARKASGSKKTTPKTGSARKKVAPRTRAKKTAADAFVSATREEAATAVENTRDHGADVAVKSIEKHMEEEATQENEPMEAAQDASTLALTQAIPALGHEASVPHGTSRHVSQAPEQEEKGAGEALEPMIDEDSAIDAEPEPLNLVDAEAGLNPLSAPITGKATPALDSVRSTFRVRTSDVSQLGEVGATNVEASVVRHIDAGPSNVAPTDADDPHSPSPAPKLDSSYEATPAKTHKPKPNPKTQEKQTTAPPPSSGAATKNLATKKQPPAQDKQPRRSLRLSTGPLDANANEEAAEAAERTPRSRDRPAKVKTKTTTLEPQPRRHSERLGKAPAVVETGAEKEKEKEKETKRRHSERLGKSPATVEKGATEKEKETQPKSGKRAASQEAGVRRKSKRLSDRVGE